MSTLNIKDFDNELKSKTKAVANLKGITLKAAVHEALEKWVHDTSVEVSFSNIARPRP